MDLSSGPMPPWLRNLELVTGVLSVLCIFAVVMMIVFHLWWRSGCTALGIC